MGVVYRVRDVVLGYDVALKTLPAHGDPDRLLHLKDEFRLLRGLTHVNLIRLYELTVTADAGFFTMELLDGTDFVTYVRSPVFSGERLRAAALQLVDGLAALHAAAILHRDIKPANVLVTSTGRLVVLDFGLASTTVSPASWHTSAGLKGTLAYMAPEQLWGRPLTPAADWYAVGVLLFEAITGRLPFDGSVMEVAHGKDHGPVPRPRQVVPVPELPDELDRLVVALLSPSPAARPDAAAIRTTFARLDREPWATGLVRTPDRELSAQPFVGRARELASLRDASRRAARGGAVTVHVEGVSGIGKSELVTRFLAEPQADDRSVVLKSRCHPRETVPFKALDGVVDDLSRFLAAQGDGEVDVLMPRHASSLLRLFPVLGRVPRMAARADQVPADAREIRRRGAAALRELLGRLAERRRLVIWIDDLQWGDMDSANLLNHVLGPPDSPDLLLILCSRSTDPAREPLLDALCSGWPEQPHTLEVGPLDPDASTELAARLHLGSEAAIRAVAYEAAGSPFLIASLARLGEDVIRSGVRLADVVSQRLAHVATDARTLLTVIALAGGPLSRTVALAAAGLAEGSRPLVFALEEANLLRWSEGQGDVVLDVYHDRIREAVVNELVVDAVAPLHRRLAEAMERQGGADPEALYRHYLLAGEGSLAGRWVLVAADRASDALAFERAAGLYRDALALSPPGADVWRLHARLAETLDNLGRGADAGEAFATAAGALAADAPSAPDLVALRTRAAQCWLRAGRLDRGIPVVRALLGDAGVRLPRTRLGILVDSQLQRLRLVIRRNRIGLPTPVDAPARVRFAVCWAASTGLAVIDPLAADGLNTRSAVAALDAGDASAAAAALGNEVTFEASLRSPLLRRHAARLLERTRELAAAAGGPYDEAAYQKALGTHAYVGMRWRAARMHCDAAASLWRDRCHGVSWEIITAESFAMTALAHMGELREVAARLPLASADAEARGDLYGATGLHMGMPTLAGLAQDCAEAVRDAADAAIASWPPGTFVIQHYLHLLATTHADLYLGEPWTAFRRVQSAWPAVWRGGMLVFGIVATELRALRARAAMAAATAMEAPGAGPDAAWPPSRLVALAVREARRLERMVHLPPARPFASLIRAGVAHATGRDAEAIRTLDEAASGFAAADMALHRAAARLVVGRWRGGEAGAALRQEAETWMRSQGGVAPASLARAVALPGA